MARDIHYISHFRTSYFRTSYLLLLPTDCLLFGPWRPGKASRDERIRFVAYHMEHYIRRMANPRVQVAYLCFVLTNSYDLTWRMASSACA